MNETVTIARTHLPVSMQGDQPVLEAVLREVAEREGCDPTSIRNVRTVLRDTDPFADPFPVTMLVALAEVDRP